MNNNKLVILDASALLALIQEEKGSEIIKPLLKRSMMSAVNIAETLIVLQKRGLLSQRSLKLIKDIISDIIPFDLKQAELVADLPLSTQRFGLSLGDKACITLGMLNNCPVYTADKVWAQLTLDCQIILIR